MDDEEATKAFKAYQLASDLSGLSVDELVLLETRLGMEINRVRAEREEKASGLAAANSLFRS